MRYPLDRGGPKRVEVTLGGAWVARVRLDDRELGAVEGRAALEAGRDFPLDDGTVLRLQLHPARFFPRLAITRDGVPLPGSPTDPVTPMRFSSVSLFLLAGFALLGAAGSTFTEARAFQRFDFTQAIAAAVYFILAAHVYEGSLVALAAAGIFVALDTFWVSTLLNAHGYGVLTPDNLLRALVLLNVLIGLAAQAKPRPSRQ